MWTLAIQKHDHFILPPLKYLQPFIKCFRKRTDTGLHMKNMMYSVSHYPFIRMAVNVSKSPFVFLLVFLKMGKVS